MEWCPSVPAPLHRHRPADPSGSDAPSLLAGAALLGPVAAVWTLSLTAPLSALGVRATWLRGLLAGVAGLAVVVTAVAAARSRATGRRPSALGRDHLPLAGGNEATDEATDEAADEAADEADLEGFAPLTAAVSTELAEMRQALDEQRLDLVYEPLVIPSTDTVAGAEARLQWHPSHGPTRGHDQVVDAATRAGIDVELGVWMVEQAIAERSRWPTGMFVAVDVPGVLIHDPGPLVRAVSAACRRHGVRPEDLWLEFDERAVADVPSAAAALQAVAATGARIVLDRFGARDASLVRLRELPVDACKLDPSLVQRLLEPAGMFVVKAVRTVVHAYDMEVVAAGVSDPDQRLLLDDLGFDLLQGDSAHGPLTDTAFRALLRVLPGMFGDRSLPELPEPPEPVEEPPTLQQRILYYHDDNVLVDWVCDVLAAGLVAERPVVVIASSSRLHRLTESLLERGLDVGDALRSGRLVEVDADDVLDRLLVDDGTPDATAFEHILEDLLVPGRPWIYSEMSTLLWERGDIVSMLALEELWEQVLEREAFLLLRSHRTGDPLGDDAASDALEW